MPIYINDVKIRVASFMEPDTDEDETEDIDDLPLPL